MNSILFKWKRYRNFHNLANLSYEEAFFEKEGEFEQDTLKVEVSFKYPIAKLDASCSSKSSKDFNFLNLNNIWYVEIIDCIVDSDWRALGIGSKMFNMLLVELKMKLPRDTIVYGLMDTQDSIRFWKRYGFSFAELSDACTESYQPKEERPYMFQKLSDLAVLLSE